MHHRHVLLSIHPEFTRAILDGSKTVEIRRGRVRWDAGDWVWLYATAPLAHVAGVVVVNYVDVADADDVWRAHRVGCGLSRGRYRAYTRGAPVVSAIGIADRIACKHPLNLGCVIGRVCIGGRPPQRYRTLRPGDVTALLVDPNVQARRRDLDALTRRLRAVAGPGGS